MEDKTIRLYSKTMTNSYGEIPIKYDLEYIHFGIEIDDINNNEIALLKQDFNTIKQFIAKDKFKLYFSNIDDLIKESDYIDNTNYLENIYLKIRKEDEINKIPNNSCKNIIIDINDINNYFSLIDNKNYNITLSINNIKELEKDKLNELSNNYNIKNILINSINYANKSDIWIEYLKQERNKLDLNYNFSDIEHEILLTNDIFDIETYNKIIDKVNEIFKIVNINDKDCDIDKINKIYTYIINNVTYNFETLNNNTIENQTIYGLLFLNKSVCEGYCKTMKLLLNANNIECNIVGGGNAKEEGGHLWNQVKINDTWYNLDSTVDSINVKEGKKIMCYLVSDDKLLYKSNSLNAKECLKNYFNKEDLEATFIKSRRGKL